MQFEAEESCARAWRRGQRGPREGERLNTEQDVPRPISLDRASMLRYRTCDVPRRPTLALASRGPYLGEGERDAREGQLPSSFATMTPIQTRNITHLKLNPNPSKILTCTPLNSCNMASLCSSAHTTTISTLEN